MNRILIGTIVVLASGLLALSSTAIGQQALVVKALCEKRVTELPSGPLFWRIENLPTLAQQSIHSPHGVLRVRAGQAELGHGAEMPMQVSSSGAADLQALVMFVGGRNQTVFISGQVSFVS